MQRSAVKYFILLLFSVSVITPLVFAEQVNVTSTLSKRSVEVNEEIQLTIRVTGAQGNIQAPQVNFSGFDTFYTGRASHLTFINNQSTSSVEFSYVLVPKAAGRFTLTPIEMNVGGQTFRTDPIDIEVLGDQGGTTRKAPFQAPPNSSRTQSQPQSGGPMAQEPPPSYKPEDDNIFVNATVDKTTVYPNEQILLSYSLYTSYDTRYEGFQDEPQISGFWIEDFPMDRDVPREAVRVNGKRYIKADIKKIALFPQAPAEYTINPGTLKASIRVEGSNSSVFDEFFNDSFFSGGGFFARRENRLLKPPPIKIQVLPLPTEGKPASFNGAVGNFRMNATIDKQSVKQNEPVTMQIIVEGEGNIETLNKPQIPELEEFKIYESDTSSQLFKSGDVIGGRKTFEIVFIPLKAGTVDLPSLEMSFFHPRTRSYVPLRTPQFKVEVEKSDQAFTLPTSLSQQEVFKKEVTVEGMDIRYIHERIPSQQYHQVLNASLGAFVIMDMVLSLLILFGLYRSREEQIFAKNTGLKRRKYARGHAASGLKRLHAMRHGKSEAELTEFFEEVEKVVMQYVSDKFNRSRLGMTRNEVEALLQEKLGLQDPLNQEILELFRLCDESRFAKANISEEMKNKAYEIVELAIKRLEKIRL